MRTIKRLLLFCGPVSICLACHAGENLSGPPPHGKQIMVYFRQSIGGHGAGRVYGLRLEQASMPSASPSATIASLTRRRELINFEFAPHADIRLQFGRRLTWDVGRHEFGLGSAPIYNAFHLWNNAIPTPGSCAPPMLCPFGAP